MLPLVRNHVAIREQGDGELVRHKDDSPVLGFPTIQLSRTCPVGCRGMFGYQFSVSVKTRRGREIDTTTSHL